MTQGIHGLITNGEGNETACLVIGAGVPRIHSSDGVPVYQVVDDVAGMPLRMKDGSERNLLAFPSHWTSHGKYNPNDWLFAKHESLAWAALIPCFDVE